MPRGYVIVDGRTVRDPDGRQYTLEADFVLDASGFGRLLPRLLKLESPSNFPVRGAIFTHVRDHIAPEAGFDRNKILITTHPEHVDVWYWTIPFSNGCCSLGVVAEPAFFDRYPGDELQKLQAIVGEDPNLTRLLAKAAVTRERSGRSFVWTPVSDQAGLAAHKMRKLLDGESDREAVLASFVTSLDPDDEKLLRDLLGQAEGGSDVGEETEGERDH